MRDIENLTYFRSMKMGRQKPLSRYIYLISTVAFGMAIDGRAFIEDMKGGANQPDYIKILKWRMLELLSEFDQILSDSGISDEIHYGPLALEYGLNEIVELNGEEIINLFILNDRMDKKNVDAEAIFKLWERILHEFPGEIPDPLIPQGQSDLLKALKHWDKICSLANVDTKFIKDMLKEV
jgi:hypothetical protein